MNDYSEYIVRARKELATAEAHAALKGWEEAINAAVRLGETVDLLGTALVQQLAQKRQIQLGLSDPAPGP